MLVALGLSWLGDSAPKLVDGDASFLVMVGFFLLAQVAYIAAFCPSGPAACCTCTGGGCSATSPSSWRSSRCAPAGAAAMLVPVLLYGACLGTMAVLSTGVNRLTAVGGALFLVSDGLIALDAFVDGFGLPAQGFRGDGHLPRRPGPPRGRRAAREPACGTRPHDRRMPSALGERDGIRRCVGHIDQ